MEDFPEEKSEEDYIHSGLKAVISFVPGAGGPLSVLFETVFSAPIEERKVEWFKKLGKAIEDLTIKYEGLTPESLSKNEKFISVAIQASQIALRNHQEEKLNALRNCVLNTAIESKIDEDRALVFTRIVDSITPLHIKLLSFLKDPEILKEKFNSKSGRDANAQNSSIRNQSNSIIWYEWHPELKQQGDLINLIVRDLFANGFISTDKIDMGFGSVITDFGRAFFNFISDSNTKT